MAHVVVIGAGIGGLPTAYELRHLLPHCHTITLISETSKFTFIPSLPWVALGLTSLSKIQFDFQYRVQTLGINLVLGRVTALDPLAQKIRVGGREIPYDIVVIATGAELALDEIPGLGPTTGYTHSVCNPHHAKMAYQGWMDFLNAPGPLVVGAVPGAGCLGPVYEFALLADFVLRREGLRAQVPITLITPEPFVGHLGIGGMANSQPLVRKLLAKRQIQVIENAAIAHISSDLITLTHHKSIPFHYSMLLPAFRGLEFVRNVSHLGDQKGFLPVLPTYQHPKYDSIYAVGIAVQIRPPEQTEISIGVPKTGQMTEAMSLAVAHNIAVKLGSLSSQSLTPILQAICLADFGDGGIVFLADPVLPDPVTQKRRKAVAIQGRWVSWVKVAFEKFFLAKMRWGLSVPWFERFVLKLLGFTLVKPL